MGSTQRDSHLRDSKKLRSSRNISPLEVGTEEEKSNEEEKKGDQEQTHIYK